MKPYLALLYIWEYDTALPRRHMHREWRSEEPSKEKEEENVLILQGGGSLGAYECGVCKAFANHDIEFDIIGGTSIGAANAAILTAGKYPKENEKQGGSYYHQYQESSNKFRDKVKILEDFWLYIAEENFGNWIFPMMSDLMLPPHPSTDEARMMVSSMRTLALGNPKVAIPRWFIPWSPDYFTPWKWPYLYDTSPLRDTLAKYVNFSLLGPTTAANLSATGQTNTYNNISNNDEIRKPAKIPRLIMTATDIQSGQSKIFDSDTMHIDASTIAGCCGYPFYGMSWAESNGKYLWDGSLLRNTILLSIFEASPYRPKKVYVANVFPKVQQEMPSNMLQILHRARDILFEDKTSEIHESLLTHISDLISLLDQMNQFLKSDLLSDIIAKNNKNNELQEQLNKLRKQYNNVTAKRGALIKSLVRVQR